VQLGNNTRLRATDDTHPATTRYTHDTSHTPVQLHGSCAAALTMLHQQARSLCSTNADSGMLLHLRVFRAQPRRKAFLLQAQVMLVGLTAAAACTIYTATNHHLDPILVQAPLH